MGGDYDYGDRRRRDRYYESDRGAGGYGGSGSAWNHHHQGRNGSGYSDKFSHTPLPQAFRGVTEANEPTEWALHCVAVVLEHHMAEKAMVDKALTQLVAWLTPQPAAQVVSMVAAAGLGGVLVRTMRRYRNEAPYASAACLAGSRAASTSEGANVQLRAGALDEVAGLMDRHPNHGGIQNVTLLLVSSLLKDTHSARQAVSIGLVARVLRAMEATNGREVQYNGLAVLRTLADHGRAPRAGLQEAALRAKAHHQADIHLLNLANDVLALVTPRFKEMLCWHWQSGWCKLGPRCTYAHGPSDLRGGSGGAAGSQGIGAVQ